MDDADGMGDAGTNELVTRQRASGFTNGSFPSIGGEKNQLLMASKKCRLGIMRHNLRYGEPRIMLSREGVVRRISDSSAR